MVSVDVKPNVSSETCNLSCKAHTVTRFPQDYRSATQKFILFLKCQWFHRLILRPQHQPMSEWSSRMIKLRALVLVSQCVNSPFTASVWTALTPPAKSLSCALMWPQTGHDPLTPHLTFNKIPSHLNSRNSVPLGSPMPLYEVNGRSHEWYHWNPINTRFVKFSSRICCVIDYKPNTQLWSIAQRPSVTIDSPSPIRSLTRLRETANQQLEYSLVSCRRHNDSRHSSALLFWSTEPNGVCVYVRARTCVCVCARVCVSVCVCACVSCVCVGGGGGCACA